MTLEFKVLVLFAMLFCHIVDDYYLQGILASMKQKSWWEANAPRELYKNDYKMALFEHAFSWSFVMSLPLTIIAIYYQINPLYFILLVLCAGNTLVHAYIDDLKANKHKINLVEDQLYHFIQILATWIFGTIML